MNSDDRIRMVLYTRQPFVAHGLSAVLQAHQDLELVACRQSLSGALDCLKSSRPDVLLVHPVGGVSLSELREIRSVDSRCQIIVWGQKLEGEFAFQVMLLGVRSILPGDTTIEDFLATVRNVHRGVTCFEKELLDSVLSQQRVALTPRQGQIISLVAQGLKNKEIAFTMGITEGTVKVYLHKLFKKLGVNDRLDMALYGRKNLFGGDSGLPGRVADRPIVTHSLLLLGRKQAGASMLH